MAKLLKNPDDKENHQGKNYFLSTLFDHVVGCETFGRFPI